jgi:hypothetical protein
MKLNRGIFNTQTYICTIIQEWFEEPHSDAQSQAKKTGSDKGALPS